MRLITAIDTAPVLPRLWLRLASTRGGHGRGNVLRYSHTPALRPYEYVVGQGLLKYLVAGRSSQHNHRAEGGWILLSHSCRSQNILLLLKNSLLGGRRIPSLKFWFPITSEFCKFQYRPCRHRCRPAAAVAPLQLCSARPRAAKDFV